MIMKRKEYQKQLNSKTSNASTTSVNTKWMIIGLTVGVLAQLLILWGMQVPKFNEALILILFIGDVMLAIGVDQLQNWWKQRAKHSKSKTN